MTRPPPGLEIRGEHPEDADRIFEITQQAFAGMPFAAGDEGALIEEGLQQMRQRGALGCILTGNPDYYQRFGFVPAAEYAPSNEPAEYFLLKALARQPAKGRFEFHPAFYAEGADS